MVQTLIRGKRETLTILGNGLMSEKKNKVDRKINLKVQENRHFQNMSDIKNSSLVYLKEEVELYDALDLCDELEFDTKNVCEIKKSLSDWVGLKLTST